VGGIRKAERGEQQHHGQDGRTPVQPCQLRNLEIATVCGHLDHYQETRQIHHQVAKA
jgi:hypothetical protein